eukprot:scaffold264404_cov34-Prasinocladus_malaysianus.AAC.1
MPGVAQLLSVQIKAIPHERKKMPKLPASCLSSSGKQQAIGIAVVHRQYSITCFSATRLLEPNITQMDEAISP